ncbi:Ger(x)C family spore germination protein [Clostridium sp. Ade.TY]|uniref:Ger(x)C family spore germination protein n=1 Tax=Clostridium sp. Ade.TY TaxID=1391647 RepID=UPI00041A9E18|nr:Ger(x)C family spore germination protein [Clostridium sp. Ade.TY]
MKINNKKILFITLIIVIISLNLSSCFNYSEVNQVTFATGVIFDLDENNNVVIYTDCIKPHRNANQSSDSGKRILYKGVGETALEAIRDISIASSYKINFTQNRAIIFTEYAAKQGLNRFIDLINNDQEFQMKPYMFVYNGDIKELLESAVNEEEYLGLFLDELVQKNKANSKVILLNTNDYLVKSQMCSGYTVMGILALREDVVDKRVELSGGAVIKNYKMVDQLNMNDGMSYNFLMNKMKTGTLEVPNPQDKKKLSTLEILGSKTDTSIDYNKKSGIIRVTKNVNVKTTIAESQGKLIISNNAVNLIKKEAENNLKDDLLEFANRYLSKGEDILQVTRALERKYIKVREEDLLSNIDVVINVNIDIKGVGQVKNSLE